MPLDRAPRPLDSTNDVPDVSPVSGVPSQGTYFLGRYRIIDEIGLGGMASVHLARVDGLGGFQRWFAIKRIHAHLVEDETFVNMFLDEANIAARISHPNVATVFELGRHDDTYWIAMEYLHGEPLREVMRRTEEMGATMPPEIACRVIAEAADGLHAAHELQGKDGEKLNLIHRDVTPHNLFVTYEGVTKVVDFGIAKFQDRMASTQAGTLKGKLAYMSPEQVQGEPIDRRTDIFALGVVLWELTTGQRLFRMDSDLDTLAKVQECNIPPPSTMVRGYPLDLEKILMQALAKNRNDRFPTAREFSRALQSLLTRRGLFIASDEVAAYMASIFVDRIAKREEHLRWASAVSDAAAASAAAALKQTAPPPPPRAQRPPTPPPPPVSARSSAPPTLSAAAPPVSVPAPRPLGGPPRPAAGAPVPATGALAAGAMGRAAGSPPAGPSVLTASQQNRLSRPPTVPVMTPSRPSPGVLAAPRPPARSYPPPPSRGASYPLPPAVKPALTPGQDDEDDEDIHEDKTVRATAAQQAEAHAGYDDRDDEDDATIVSHSAPSDTVPPGPGFRSAGGVAPGPLVPAAGVPASPRDRASVGAHPQTGPMTITRVAGVNGQRTMPLTATPFMNPQPGRPQPDSKMGRTQMGLQPVPLSSVTTGPVPPAPVPPMSWPSAPFAAAPFPPAPFGAGPQRPDPQSPATLASSPSPTQPPQRAYADRGVPANFNISDPALPNDLGRTVALAEAPARPGHGWAPPEPGPYAPPPYPAPSPFDAQNPYGQQSPAHLQGHFQDQPPQGASFANSALAPHPYPPAGYGGGALGGEPMAPAFDAYGAPLAAGDAKPEVKGTARNVLRPKRVPAWAVAVASGLVALVLAGGLVLVYAVVRSSHGAPDGSTAGGTAESAGGSAGRSAIPNAAAAPGSSSAARTSTSATSGTSGGGAAKNVGAFYAARLGFLAAATPPPLSANDSGSGADPEPGAQAAAQTSGQAPGEPAAPPPAPPSGRATDPTSAADPTPAAVPDPTPPPRDPTPLGMTPPRRYDSPPTVPAEAVTPVQPPTPRYVSVPTPAPAAYAAGGALPKGFLSVICIPGCDRVELDGQPLGASPIFKHSTPVGSHRIKLVSSNPPGTKVVSKIVVAGSTAMVRESMP